MRDRGGVAVDSAKRAAMAVASVERCEGRGGTTRAMVSLGGMADPLEAQGISIRFFAKLRQGISTLKEDKPEQDREQSLA